MACPHPGGGGPPLTGGGDGVRQLPVALSLARLGSLSTKTREGKPEPNIQNIIPGRWEGSDFSFPPWRLRHGWGKGISLGRLCGNPFPL